MKNFLLTWAAVFLAGAVHAQQKPADLSAVDRQVAAIQSALPSFKKVEKAGISEGFLYIYLKDGELQLIHIQSVEPDLEKDVRRYYLNGQMIFTETNWTNPDGHTRFSEKCYFQDTRLIAWITDGQAHDASSPEFQKMEQRLVAYDRDLRLRELGR